MSDFFTQRFETLVLDPFEWDREGQRLPVLEDFSPSCKDVLGMLYRADAAVPGGRGGLFVRPLGAVSLAMRASTEATCDRCARMRSFA